MSRTKGSKNHPKTTEEKTADFAERIEKKKNKAVQETNPITDETVSVEPSAGIVSANSPGSPDQILAAIGSLANMMQRGFENFEQRINLLETNPVKNQTTLANPDHVEKFSSPPKFNTDVRDLPSWEEQQRKLQMIETEVDAIYGGIEQAQAKEIPLFGRAAPARIEVKCVRCNRPPTSERNWAWQWELNEDGTFIHSSCIGR